MTATATALPPVHMPHQGGDPHDALRELRAAIEHEILHQPRSLQKRIGPSEIGNPCDHCLAARLAGWEQNHDGIPWLPYIGTAMHAQLEELFIRLENDRNANHTTGRRYLAEQRVMVGHIGGQEIWGSTDLVDLAVGMTVDWKLVGASTLRTVRRGPSEVYRVQADLYAKGWNDAGYRVDHVAICYLPRNSVTLNDAVWWTAPHDRGRAEDALERANRLHDNLTALAPLGEQVVNQWISGLPRADGCHECPRYPDGIGMSKPGHAPAGDQLAGLIPPTGNPAGGTTAA